MVIDGDGHCNEPRDLFDRYLEKEFRERGPKVVDASGTRWMIEGKFLPRPVGTWPRQQQRLFWHQHGQEGHGHDDAVA